MYACMPYHAIAGHHTLPALEKHCTVLGILLLPPKLHNYYMYPAFDTIATRLLHVHYTNIMTTDNTGQRCPPQKSEDVSEEV